ncbi:MAG: hypothetical protein KBA66_16745 [Leptospiraceae bacterium]|nr:hypothetical protein [Leptospiraceae bacterium]
MNTFIQTITDLFLDREEFLRIYSPMNNTTKFIEFFSILLGAISLSVSAVLVNPPYSSGYIALILFLAIGNYFFLSLVSSYTSYFLDFKAKNLMKSGDFPTLIASARCLNIVYIFSGPIAITLSFAGIPSFSAFILVVVITTAIYIWIFSGYANELYGMGLFRTFRNITTSIFYILYIPFMILIYLFMNLTAIV